MPGIGQTDSVRQTGFGSSMHELNHQVELLIERLGLLYARIEPFRRLAMQPLLNPQSKTVPSTQKQPTPAQPSALLEIDSISERLEQIRIVLDECISRLEI